MAWLQANAAKATNVDPASNDSDATDPAETARWGSARKALRTFVIAMEGKDYRTAILAVDFSSIAPSPDSFTQISYAQRLKACMDRLSLVDASQFSDDANADPVTFPPDKADSDIILSRGDDGNWKFTAKTVAEIDSIYEVLKDSPPLGQELAVASEPTTEDRQTTDESPAASTDPDGEVMVKEAAASQVPDELKSARRTVRSLFESLESKDYALAVRALDFSAVEAKDPELGPYARLERTRRLKEIIERMASIDYAAISDDPEGPTFRFPAKDPNQPIVIGRDETRVWRFTADTVAKIDSLHALYKNEPILNVSDEQKPWYDRKLVLGNETWRLLALFVAIFSDLLLGQVSKAMLLWWADQFERRGSNLRAVVAKTLAASAVGILFLIGLNIGMRMLVLEHEVETFVTTTIRVIFSLVVGYISFRLVDVAVEMLRELAKRTGSTLNNMLVPIVSTSLRLTVIVTVVLDIATAVSDQPPSTVLAGLGAGGLAIGLAAQDTIKNLFGSVMIFADRPFELGDRIVIDGHDGPVEQVGFRSTRIRTLDGHLVTIPNGEMAN